MKKILCYALAATTLALTSCKKNVLETPSAADNAIHIVASIASQARAPQRWPMTEAEASLKEIKCHCS